MDPSIRQNDGEVRTEPHNGPDLMNDPEYATNTKDRQPHLDEADTCRICRGDGSQQEPLFYPCKCSGSIKFVHQNCLMEWLSHSQKKHCELCKTPFHFTKLYHPHMPSTVPLPIFFRQAAVHTWKSLVTSSRFLLVVFVWAAWLPWCMRNIWRALFWLGDGAWADWAERRLQDENMAMTLSSKLAMENRRSVEQDFSPSQQTTASALIGQTWNKLPHLTSSIRQVFKLSSGQPWGLALLRKASSFLTGGIPSSISSTSVPSNVTGPEQLLAGSSWLSESELLKNLTPSTILNNLIIDTLEGQLITLFVVVAFILVFLIREWVVQQQPALNGGNAPDAEIPVPQDADAPGLLEPNDRIGEMQGGGNIAEAGEEGMQALGPRAMMIARARARRPAAPRRPSEQDGIHNNDVASNAATDGSEVEGRPSEQDGIRNDDVASNAATDGSEAGRVEADVGSSLSPLGFDNAWSRPFAPDLELSQPQRPEMPHRDTLAKAAEIRRMIEEHSPKSDAPDSAMEVFENYWDKAGREPLEVIKVIEQEGRDDELGWIVAAMRKIEGLRQGVRLTRANMPPTSGEENVPDITGSNSDDDEGFTFLNKPSLSPSPDIGVTSCNGLGAGSDTSPQTSASPILSSSNTEPQAPTWPVSEGSKPVPQDLLERHITQGVEDIALQEVPEEQTAKLPSDDSGAIEAKDSTMPVDQSRNNPFHPNYEGELPNTSDLPPDSARDTPLQPSPSHGTPTNRRTIIERVSDWLWGGVAPLPLAPEQPAGDDEHVVNDIRDEAPFVPMDRGQPLRLAANAHAIANQDPDVVAAAMQAGVDPNEVEAVEEIEDLEGILELVGMQGPLAGLVQNAMFCACLVSLTVAFGVYMPYVYGKVLLVILANPVSLLFRIPLRWAASTADTVIDLFIFCAGLTIYWTDTILSIICAPLAWIIPPSARINQNRALAEAAITYAQGALARLAQTFTATHEALSETDFPMFSLTAHESLQSIETRIAWTMKGIADGLSGMFSTVHDTSGVADFFEVLKASVLNHASNLVNILSGKTLSAVSLWRSLRHINPLSINLSLPQRSTPVDYDLAYWSMKDQIIAIVFGYLFIAVLGVLYIRLRSWMKGTNKAGKVAGVVADGLYQAGGVMKVVLIISIEMIVFPLYCGTLLDVALLPLFGNVTIMSRINFTLTSPITSLFVHWFVGTCYMFHFALFVSMCRKILRSGVLYFIRDPDDPTFHPVRDVLERSVSTQLWKISFSALVYGGLVIVCLGGVVWGIAYSFAGVLPIQWSSNEPILEFPVDLLFYNFLMPLAVRFFKPSKGLNQIYSWWFRKCARILRLTNFLFGEKKEDEEGRQVRPRVTGASEENEDQSANTHEQETTFIQEGRYVRAPGSDQVRIPRDATAFLEVDRDNNRVDGQADSDDGLHGRKNEMFTTIYVPPHFRLRISAFILLIWLFAAATGISMTILPLVLGRFFFAKLSPSHLQTNDIFAFSVGIYFFGGVFYGLSHRHTIATYIRDTLAPHTTTVSSLLRKSLSVTGRFLALVYTYAAFGILLPALLSLLMEFYLIIPLHTYFSTTFTSLDTIQSERHIVHVIQLWTLGVLYVRMAARVILWHGTTRPATALRAIVRDGWLQPDARLATRGFILPAALAVLIALATPLGMGWLANTTVFRVYSAKDQTFRACVYRYSYPAILAVGLAATLAWALAKAFSGWRKKVRDEVYLIGERLHNFGEAKRRKGGGKGKGRAEVEAG